MDWDLSIDVDWLVDVYDFLGDCRDLNCLYDLFYDFERNFLFDFDVFGHLNDFLHNSLRSRNGPWYLHNHFNWLLNNNLLDNLFWNNAFMPVNLSISVLE